MTEFDAMVKTLNYAGYDVVRRNDLDKLRADNARLRGALFEVIVRAVLVEGTTWKDTANEMATIAKAALDAVEWRS